MSQIRARLELDIIRIREEDRAMKKESTNKRLMLIGSINKAKHLPFSLRRWHN